MNKYKDRIMADFADNVEVNLKCRELIDTVIQAGEAVIDSLNRGGKVMTAGNGGSSGDAQHLSSEFVNRFERDRNPLPAIALVGDSAIMTSIGNDFGYEYVFSKPIQALGKAEDTLILFTTSGNSANLLTAYKTAKKIGMKVIVFSGKDGGKLAGMMEDDDIEIRIPSSRTARIQEMHLFFIHSICDYIDEKLFFSK